MLAVDSLRTAPLSSAAETATTTHHNHLPAVVNYERGILEKSPPPRTSTQRPFPKLYPHHLSVVPALLDPPERRPTPFACPAIIGAEKRGKCTLPAPAPPRCQSTPKSNKKSRENEKKIEMNATYEEEERNRSEATPRPLMCCLILIHPPISV